MQDSTGENTDSVLILIQLCTGTYKLRTQEQVNFILDKIDIQTCNNVTSNFNMYTGTGELQLPNVYIETCNIVHSNFSIYNDARLIRITLLALPDIIL